MMMVVRGRGISTLRLAMPIELQSEICVFDQEEFTTLNRRVLRLAFDVHNEFGRFLDEEMCKRELAARCIEAGISPVEREVRIQVKHDNFRKDYLMDMLLAKGLMLDAKASESLTKAHHSQALNYLLLTGMQHGTLVNFRGSRVEHPFVSTQLTPARRRQFTADDRRWLNQDSDAEWLKQRMLDLLADWGAFLEVTLYREAVTHFLSYSQNVHRPVELFSGTRALGTQDMFLLTDKAAFSITAIISNLAEYESHLSRFLHHTRLDHLHWINLNHHTIAFTSLNNSSRLCR